LNGGYRHCGFYGHATIALGSVLAERTGNGAFSLDLNAGRITVEVQRDDQGIRATLTSPPTWSAGLTAIASLAAGGQGVALLPDDMQRADLSRQFTCREAASSCLWILTHPDLRGVQRISPLMGFLSNAFRRDPYWTRHEG